MKDRGQRRSRILDVGVDGAGAQCLLGDERSPEIKAAIDAKIGCALDRLGQELPENDLLREILRPDDDAGPPAPRQGESAGNDHHQRNNTGGRSPDGEVSMPDGPWGEDALKPPKPGVNRERE